MKYVIAALFIPGFTLLAPSAGAAEGVATIECSQVENARERLACFDAMYPLDPARPIAAPKPRVIAPGPAPVAPTAPISRANTPEEVLTDPNTGAGVASSNNPAEDAPIRGQSKSSKGGLFRNDPRIDFSSTIAAIKAEPQKKMVFRLANDQIWIQSSPREVPIKVGDVITIKSSLLGGFMLANEKGVTTRVTRIK